NLRTVSVDIRTEVSPSMRVRLPRYGTSFAPSRTPGTQQRRTYRLKPGARGRDTERNAAPPASSRRCVTHATGEVGRSVRLWTTGHSFSATVAETHRSRRSARRG